VLRKRRTTTIKASRPAAIPINPVIPTSSANPVRGSAVGVRARTVLVGVVATLVCAAPPAWVAAVVAAVVDPAVLVAVAAAFAGAVAGTTLPAGVVAVRLGVLVGGIDVAASVWTAWVSSTLSVAVR